MAHTQRDYRLVALISIPYLCQPFISVEKNRLERILPKRGNLTKALSMEASDSKSAMKLKKAKPSMISESSASESNGDLSQVMGSQGSGLQDIEHSNRES